MTSPARPFDPALDNSSAIGDQHRAELKAALRDGASPFPVLIAWQVALREAAERALPTGYTVSLQVEPIAELERALRVLVDEQLAAAKAV